MATHHVSGPDQTSPPAPVAPWRSFAEWFVGVFGAFSVFMGGFILLGGDDQYVGFGNEYSWRVGDLSVWWGVGLIAGGVLALLLVFASVRQRKR